MVHYVHRHAAVAVSQNAAMSESHGCNSAAGLQSAPLPWRAITFLRKFIYAVV